MSVNGYLSCYPNEITPNAIIYIDINVENWDYWDFYEDTYIGELQAYDESGNYLFTIKSIDEWMQDYYSNNIEWEVDSYQYDLMPFGVIDIRLYDGYGNVITNTSIEKVKVYTTTGSLLDQSITLEETTSFILDISGWSDPSEFDTMKEYCALYIGSNTFSLENVVRNGSVWISIDIEPVELALPVGTYNISFTNDDVMYSSGVIDTLTITHPVGFFSNVTNLSLNDKNIKQLVNMDNDKVFYSNENAQTVVFEPPLDGTDNITSWTNMTNKTENGIFYSHGSFLTDGWSNNGLWKLEFDVKADNWTYIGLMPVCDARINPYTDANAANYAMVCWEGITYTGGLGLTAWESQDSLSKITNSNWHHMEYTKLSDTRVKIVIDNTYTAIGNYPNLPNLTTLHIGSRDNQYSRDYGGVVQYKNIKVMGPKEPLCDTIELEGFNGTVGDTAMQSGRVVGYARFKKNNATISANGEQAIFELRRADNNVLVNFIETEISADYYAYFDIESRKLGDLKLTAQHGTVKSNTLIIEDCNVYNTNTYTNTSPTIASTHPLPMQLDFDIKKTNTSSTATGILLIGNTSYPHLGLGFGSSSNYGLVIYERRAYATNNQIINITNTSTDWIHITAKIYQNKAIMTVNGTDYTINNIQIDLSAPIVWNGANNSQQYVSIKNIKVKKLME